MAGLANKVATDHGSLQCRGHQTPSVSSVEVAFSVRGAWAHASYFGGHLCQAPLQNPSTLNKLRRSVELTQSLLQDKFPVVSRDPSTWSWHALCGLRHSSLRGQARAYAAVRRNIRQSQYLGDVWALRRTWLLTWTPLR